MIDSIGKIWSELPRVEVLFVIQCFFWGLAVLTSYVALSRHFFGHAQLNYSVLACRTVVDKKRFQNIKVCLKVKYHNEKKQVDQRVDDQIVVTLIALWNPSDIPIKKGDINNFHIVLPNEAGILDAMVVNETRKVIGSTVNNQDNKIIIDFDCIGGRDGIVVKVVHLKPFSVDKIVVNGVYLPQNGTFFQRYNQLPVDWRWRDMMYNLVFQNRIKYTAAIPLLVVMLLSILLAPPVQSRTKDVFMVLENMMWAIAVGAFFGATYTLYLCRVRQVPLELSEYFYSLDSRTRGRYFYKFCNICEYMTCKLNAIRGR